MSQVEWQPAQPPLFVEPPFAGLSLLAELPTPQPWADLLLQRQGTGRRSIQQVSRPRKQGRGLGSRPILLLT